MPQMMQASAPIFRRSRLVGSAQKNGGGRERTSGVCCISQPDEDGYLILLRPKCGLSPPVDLCLAKGNPGQRTSAVVYFASLVVYHPRTLRTTRRTVVTPVGS
jgi:hypothetical protein